MGPIIVNLLKESKTNNSDLVDLDYIDSIVGIDDEDDITLEDLIEFINLSTDNSLMITRKTGSTRMVKILDKIPLYLMLYGLNQNLATVDLLTWQDFEKLVKFAFEENGFITIRDFRFKDPAGKRHQIDVVAIDKYSKEHFIFLIDAKHWNFKTNSNASNLLEAADKQFERVVALGNSINVLSKLLFDLKLPWSHVVLQPLMITLLSPPVQSYYIPIVSILSFNQFILQFSEHADYFKKKRVTGIPVQLRLI
ncbi:MAG: nuclease-related domain-containing protein [Promethearchaeota archaeon]